MRYYQEITQWDTKYSVQNHIYYLKDDKTRAIGYIPYGQKKLVKFSKPISFDVRGRKFVEVMDGQAEADVVYFGHAEIKPTLHSKQIKGSNGKIYNLSKIGNKWSCTCPGFTFRHTCKHTAEI